METTNEKITSQAETADEKKKLEEQAKEAERRRIKKQAERESTKFVRIAGTWFKKCQNIDGEWVLEQYRASDIISDYGRKLGLAILDAAPKCINRVNLPQHVDYKEFLQTVSGDVYYNTYRPLKYKPIQGEWSHVETLVRHIFGEQFELGLDYIQLLYTKPLIRLPILVLVSTENGTGKSTFCNFLREIFGDNAKAITKDTLDSRFNSTWATKLLAYCEETVVEHHTLIDKIKNYATAERIPTEKKGYDMSNEKVFIKLIMCSNNETRPTLIDKNDTRHWVRKVPRIENNSGADFLQVCKEEIPAFLFFLENRKLKTSGTKRDRLWFWHDEIVTDAWRRIVAASKPEIERNIASMLEDIMDGAGVDEVCYSTTELLKVILSCVILSDYEKRRLSNIKLRDILRSWGIEAPRKNVRHVVYSLDSEGKVKSISFSSKAFRITRALIQEFLE